MDICTLLCLGKKIKKEKFNVSKPFVSIIEPFLTCTFCILAYYLCSASDTTDDELGHVSQSESRSGDGWNSILSNRKGCYWRFLGQKGQPLHCVCLQHHLIWNGSICHIAHCARMFQKRSSHFLKPTKKNKTIFVLYGTSICKLHISPDFLWSYLKTKLK